MVAITSQMEEKYVTVQPQMPQHFNIWEMRQQGSSGNGTAKLKGIFFFSHCKLPETPNLTIIPTVCWKWYKVTRPLLSSYYRKSLPVPQIWEQLCFDTLCFANLRAAWGLTGITFFTPATLPFTAFLAILLIHTTSTAQVHHYETTSIFHNLRHNNFIVLVWYLHRKQLKLQEI